MRKFFILTAVASTMTLAACDGMNRDLRRVLVGGAIGCAAGEVLVDGRCTEGAVVGAGVAAITN